MTFWEMTFDGWFGAVLGSLVSIGVAVYVLRRTLAADREQFLEQLESERTLAMEQRRLEAFGDVAGGLRRLQTIPGEDEIAELYGQVALAVSRWRMFVPRASLGLSLEALSLALLRGTLTAGRTPGDAWRPRVSKAILRTIEDGRRWHVGDIDDRELQQSWDSLTQSMMRDLPDSLPSPDAKP